MDKFDDQIISILTLNARTPVSQIAKAVSLSRTAVDARIKKLEKTGIISGYKLVLNESNLNKLTRSYVSIKLNSCSCQTLIPDILKFSEVKQCYPVAGEIDIICYMETEGTEKILEIVKFLENRPVVQSIRTHMILS